MSSSVADQPHSGTGGVLRPNFMQELWRYRELLYFLIWRDLKVRYKQTALGAAWAVIQPLALMVVFTILFGRLGGLQSEGLPYEVFVFAGLVPWTFFSSSVLNASTSLVNNSHLITKVYFPRLLLPLATAAAYLVDFLIATVVLLVMMPFFGAGPSLEILALPVFLLLLFLLAASIATMLSALNVRYRDVRYALPFLLQVWLFLSPVVIPPSQIPGRWRLIYDLNPMSGLLQGFRWSFFGAREFPARALLISVAWIVLIALLSRLYFRKVERRFADVI